MWRAWAPRYMHSRSEPPYSTVRFGRPGTAAMSRMDCSAEHARGASDSSVSANALPLRNSDVFSSISCARRGLRQQLSGTAPGPPAHRHYLQLAKPACVPQLLCSGPAWGCHLQLSGGGQAHDRRVA